MSDVGDAAPIRGPFDAPYLMDVYGKRVDNENAHITTRTGWLLTLNAFLVATIGVGLTQADKDLTLPIVTVVCVLATISNASCLFSNYWAARALDEATQRVFVELRGMFPTSDDRPEGTVGRRTDTSSHDVELWLARLRLYGRDPRDEPERVGFWRPPSSVLHPWFLIPLCFLAAFALLPGFYAADRETTGLWNWAFVLSSIWLPALIFSLGIFADRRYNARREECK